MDGQRASGDKSDSRALAREVGAFVMMAVSMLVIMIVMTVSAAVVGGVVCMRHRMPSAKASISRQCFDLKSSYPQTVEAI
jgi:hypothetical protein